MNTRNRQNLDELQPLTLNNVLNNTGSGLQLPNTNSQGRQSPQNETPPQGETTGGGAPTTSGSAVMLGGGATPSSTGPTPPQPQQQQAPQKQKKAGTGTFTNLRSYLDASKGRGVSQAATQRVANVASGAQRGIQQTEAAFKQAASQGAAQGSVEEAGQIIGTGLATTAPTDNVSGYTGAQAFTPEQMKSFEAMINAQYAGPQSLEGAGGYQETLRRVREAGDVAQQSETASGREGLLRDIFGRNRAYSRGQSALDALFLNTSAEGLGALQQQAQRAAATQSALDTAQSSSAAIAREEALRAAQLQEGVKRRIEEGYTGLQTGIDKRIAAMTTAPSNVQKKDANGKPMVDSQGRPIYLTQWEVLPTYLKEKMSGKENKVQFTARELGLSGIDSRAFSKNKVGDVYIFNQKDAAVLKDIANDPRFIDSKIQEARKNTTLSPTEMKLLGIDPGMVLYNLTEDIITSQEADKRKLISKNELARLMALSELAKLDKQNRLGQVVNFMGGQEGYSMDTAGTQSALSSVDTAAIKKKVEEQEQTFMDDAIKKAIKASGTKKYAPGNASNRYYTSTINATLNDVLKQFGYPAKMPTRQQMKKALEENAKFSSSEFAGTGVLPPGISKYFDTANWLARLDLTDKVLSELDKSGFFRRATATKGETSKAREKALKKILDSQDQTNVPAPSDTNPGIRPPGTATGGGNR